MYKYLYTECPILNNALISRKLYGKMLQTKVVWFGGGHKKILLI